MDYSKTLIWLYNQLPFYQKKGGLAYKKDVDNVLNFSKKNGKDYDSFPSIHVGGTNGKGSVSHMLSSILQESELKIGLFTSPHLLDFRERIKINNQMISEQFVIDFVKNYMTDFKNINMSFFEMTVVMAFKYFAYNNVDLAIIEVGLGGRLDSTNVISPILSIITNISIDHKDLLGDSLILITKEKAGIIKKETPILIGEKNQYTNILEKKAQALKAPVFYSKQTQYQSDLKGNYQFSNINTSATAINILNNLHYKISKNHIVNGFNHVIKNTGLRGRWEILSKEPLVICDVAHNMDAFHNILSELNISKLRKHIILGFSRDKDFKSILEILPKDYQYYICGSLNERIIDPNELSSYFDNYNLSYKIFDLSYNAYTYLASKSNKHDLIMITGSTFIVSDILKYLDKY